MGCVPPSPRRPHSPCRPGIADAGVCRIDAASVSIEVTASGPVIPMPHLRDRGAVDAGAMDGPERWRRSGESGKDAGSTRRPRGDCWVSLREPGQVGFSSRLPQAARTSSGMTFRAIQRPEGVRSKEGVETAVWTAALYLASPKSFLKTMGCLYRSSLTFPSDKNNIYRQSLPSPQTTPPEIFKPALARKLSLCVSVSGQEPIRSRVSPNRRKARSEGSQRERRLIQPLAFSPVNGFGTSTSFVV